MSFHLQYVPYQDVAELFKLADVAVFPYRAVFQSGALQVAYALETPVIATAVGGFPEVVKHEETGLLVPPRDIAALAAALTRLLRDRTLARQLGRGARRYAERCHSWKRVAEKVLTIVNREAFIH